MGMVTSQAMTTSAVKVSRGSTEVTVTSSSPESWVLTTVSILSRYSVVELRILVWRY